MQIEEKVAPVPSSSGVKPQPTTAPPTQTVVSETVKPSVTIATDKPIEGKEAKDEQGKDPKQKDEKPKDEKPKEEKPKDEKPKEEKPKDEKPKDEKAKDDKPKDDKTKDAKPKDEKPKADVKPKEVQDSLKPPETAGRPVTPTTERGRSKTTGKTISGWL